ncbi:MAG: M55 family metallopeptidase [Longimicrobiales bacterium]
MHQKTLALALALVAAPGNGATAQDPAYASKRVPSEPGFRVFIVPDMEGMGSTVAQWEILAGNEGERYRGRSSTDYWEHYRKLVTDEANAVISGARAADARSFVVNEGHGGNLFANVLPWELDPAAILIRGFPKPMVMVTGIDASFGTIMFTGAHANAGSKGVMSHNFAFDTFSVNGRILNEVGINALIAGEAGVSVLHFKIRASYPEELLAGMADVERRYNLQTVAPRSYDFVTSDARAIAYLLDEIERVVLR